MDTSHRIKALRRHMDERDVPLCLVVVPENQQYLCGFRAVLYSRPIHLLVTLERTMLVVPGLEEEHARRDAVVDDILVYYEHPEKAHAGTTHVYHLDRVVERLPRGACLGVEAAAIPLALAEHLRGRGMELVDIGPKILQMRYIKDAAEIELMLEAGRLAVLGLGASLKALEPGITEIQVDGIGNTAILEEVAATQPEATVDLFVMSPSGAERTLMPHLFSTTRPMQKGDVLIHSRQVALNGYRGESERTCFVGRPSARQEDAFRIMLEAQLAALDALRPGASMREVDAGARGVIQKAGYGDNFIHRTGHGLGLSLHEPPFLRFDEEMLVEENMVFTIEPEFFIPGVGGFRHSDTVIVGASGNRITTEYPNDLGSMIF